MGTAARASAPAGEPPPAAFLRLAGHPVRWSLLRELGRSDRRVQELTSLVGQPQNLVSYHLAQLRAAGVVSSRRSSADGRDAYYRVDLVHLRSMLAATGIAIHPGLRLAAPPPAATATRQGPTIARVLFLCTGNSARSQMAEAMVRARASGRVEARSAGSHPKPLHPNAVRVLRHEYGIDLGRARSKHLDAVMGERFDHVISLCDRVREVCPEFPGQPETAHWSMADPAAGHDGDDRGSYPAFQQVAAELDTRIGFLLDALTTPDPT